MYQFQRNALTGGQSQKYTLYQDDERLQYADFLKHLQQDEAFRLFFIELLSEVPYHAYHWETPPVTSKTIDRLFEFVVTDSPSIDLPPDLGPFRQYFDSDDEIAVFNNLGNDAKLIAPAPTDQQRNYSHIGVFTDEAPADQQQAFWQMVGQVTQEQISDQPLWLNTAGGGVAWLHVRLDSRPKYYRHRPYAADE